MFKTNITRFCLIALLLVWQLAGITSARRQKCSMSRFEAEKCAKRVYVFGDRTVRFPERYEETQHFCGQQLDAVRCLAKYSHCMKSGFKRGLLRAVVNFMEKELPFNFCVDNDNPQFFKIVYCLDNQRVRLENLHRCMDKYIVMLLHIRDRVKRDQQLAARCCAFNHLRQCARNFAKEHCEHIAGEGVVDFLESIFVRGFSQLGSCSERYSSFAKCRNEMPEIESVFEKISQESIPPQQASILFTFLDIATD